VVYLPAHRAAVHVDGRRCTWMYETRNETVPVASEGCPCQRTCGPVDLSARGFPACGTGIAGLMMLQASEGTFG
jgi:hypothetical protein